MVGFSGVAASCGASQSALTHRVWLCFTSKNVMYVFAAIAKLHADDRGDLSIPAIRIISYNVHAGKRA